MLKIILPIIVAFLAIYLTPVNHVSADVGDIEICNDYAGDDGDTNGMHLQGGTATSGIQRAQTFTPTTSFTATGVKVKLVHVSGQPDTTVTVRITATSGGAPATTTVYATETVSTASLPDAVLGFQDQVLTCDNVLALSTGTIIEFVTPIALTSGITYAIYFSATASPAAAYSPGEDEGGNIYTAGSEYWCNATCTPNTPGDWAIVSNADIPFVVFNNIVVTTPVGVADTWVVNFLRDFLGISTFNGYLLFGVGLISFLSLFLISIKIPPIMVLMIDAMAVVVGALSVIFPPYIVLVITAIGGVSILLAIVAGRNSGGQEA